MMNKYRSIFLLILILLPLTFKTILFANINEEMIFITSLYKDAYYDFALREIIKIEQKIKDPNQYNLIMGIKADILKKQHKLDQSLEILINLYNKPLSGDLKAQVMLNMADIYYQQNKYSYAIDLLQLYVSQFPDNIDYNNALNLLADIYKDNQQYNEAITIYQNLINDFLANKEKKLHSEKSAKLFRNLSMAYIYNEDYVTAEQLYRQILELSEDNQELWAVYSQEILFFLLENYEKNAEFLRIIDLCPDNFTIVTKFSDPCLFIKVSAYINLKNFIEAESLLANISEDIITGNYYRALILKEKEQNHLALPIFKLLTDIEENDSIKTMSFFNMIQIIAKTDIDSAKVKLQNFLLENPEQKWEGDIYYQLAFLEFQARNYQKAYNDVLRSLSFELSKTNNQKALYLKAEIEFLLEDFESSIKTFKNNFEDLPVSLKDESIFKIGLSYYFLAITDSAKVFFNKLISEYPHSQKTGITYYYLGEMELSNNLNQAKSYFQQAMKGDIDNNAVILRLAYIEYLQMNYKTAITELSKIPETVEYLYDKYLLKANILFSQKQYNQALEAYRIAEKNAPDQVSVEYIWSRQAWTYYNLKYYDRATAIYQRLAKTSSDTDSGNQAAKFLLSAANTAFNAENYQQALTLYNDFIDTYGNDSSISLAKMGLANSYFNLAQHDMAIDIWKTLINQNQSVSIIESTLKGLQASYQKLNKVALFTEFINLSILNSTQKEFIIMLYEYKANFEYEQKNYNASISTINQLLRTYPEKNNDVSLMILLANNYTWLKQFEQADAIYVNLAVNNNDPYIYFEWGHIKWAQNDIIAAMRRYKRAVDNSDNPEYMINYLEKLLITKDESFIEYYNKFILIANDYHKALAEIYFIEWNIHTQDYEQAIDLASKLAESSYSQLRVRAILRMGEAYYLQEEYEEALSNFLKIRYVFNEFSSLRWTSEYFICKIYFAQGDVEKARQLFNNIKANLNQNEIKSLEELLRGN